MSENVRACSIRSGLTVHEQGAVAFTMNNLMKKLVGAHGGIPEDYLVFDLETTGFLRGNDLITQVGYCMVVERKPVENFSMILDWTRVPSINRTWLRDRMVTTGMAMAEKGRNYNMDYERMMAEGLHPFEVMEGVHSLFENARKSGMLFVAHNGYNFDEPFLNTSFERWISRSWKFGDNELIDTGMLEKASQGNMFPDEADSWRSFAMRVGSMRWKGINWSLDGHCAGKYKLAEKHNLDLEDAHDAAFDCLLTHHLLEEFREIAEQAPGEVTVS